MTVRHGSLPIRIIGCPLCGADRDQPCRNRDGSYRPSHLRRRRAFEVLVRVVDALEDDA